MKTITKSLVILLAPAALFAQAGGQAGAQAGSATTARTGGTAASANASATAQATGEFRAPSSFSAEGQAKLNAMYAEAKEHKVPREPMAKRVDEGRAKGANETAVIASAGKVKANLEASQEAMVAAGRSHPSDEECARGESAMERGVTKAQITAIAKSAPGDRSLVVAFDVLTRLAARGVPVTQAVAQVQTNMTSGAGAHKRGRERRCDHEAADRYGDRRGGRGGQEAVTRSPANASACFELIRFLSPDPGPEFGLRNLALEFRADARRDVFGRARRIGEQVVVAHVEPDERALLEARDPPFVARLER
jgi:hypothetical protein